MIPTILIAFIIFSLFMIMRKKAENNIKIAVDKHESESDATIRQEDKRFTLLSIVNGLKKFEDCDYLLNVEDIANSIYENTVNALKFRNDPEYSKYVIWVIKKYNSFQDEDATDLQKDYILNLKEFDKTKAIKDKFKKIAANYKPYWDGVLGSYKRKHAEINRRKYLIENTELMASECIKQGFDDIAAIFKNYQNEQIEFLKTHSK